MNQLEALIKRHRKELFTYAYSLTKHYEKAEDLTQETLVKVFRFFHQYNSKKAFLPWARTIMKNTLLDHYRQDQVRHNLKEIFFEAPIERTDMNAIDGLSKVIEDERIEELLSLVPENLKQLMILRIIQGLSYKQIYQELNIPKSIAAIHLYNFKIKKKDYNENISYS